MADGDLVAIEAKYHLPCFHGYLQSCASSSDLPTVEFHKRQAIAFAKTSKDTLKNKTFIFKLSNLSRSCYQQN